jgi:cell division protein FtsN
VPQTVPKVIHLPNLIRALLSWVIACAFALQGAPVARAQEWSFFLECGKYPSEEQAHKKVQALGALGLSISIRRDRDRRGNMWYELVVKGMSNPDEAQRVSRLVEIAGGPHCKSELIH